MSSTQPPHGGQGELFPDGQLEASRKALDNTALRDMRAMVEDIDAKDAWDADFLSQRLYRLKADYIRRVARATPGTRKDLPGYLNVTVDGRPGYVPAEDLTVEQIKELLARIDRRDEHDHKRALALYRLLEEKRGRRPDQP
jgi:hypothetical protein